ncbi:MAG: type II secretion system GspH family protein [Lachnospiraceae bacterium]|nr:type II secretion system GspH family protein [Lachnospiraceae bacterium]
MKKITKNNKGFSLIELIIVIAIMAVLVAIIAPNLTKYLGSSKQKTDKKNADEIASQIQTCITDYETENGYLGDYSLTWTSSGLSAGSKTAFEDIVKSAITSATQSKEDSSKYATATITQKDSADASKGYDVTVTLGNVSVKK